MVAEVDREKQKCKVKRHIERVHEHPVNRRRVARRPTKTVKVAQSSSGLSRAASRFIKAHDRSKQKKKKRSHAQPPTVSGGLPGLGKRR
jgi:hypothetical protein